MANRINIVNPSKKKHTNPRKILVLPSTPLPKPHQLHQMRIIKNDQPQFRVDIPIKKARILSIGGQPRWTKEPLEQDQNLKEIDAGEQRELTIKQIDVGETREHSKKERGQREHNNIEITTREEGEQSKKQTQSEQSKKETLSINGVIGKSDFDNQQKNDESQESLESRKQRKRLGKVIECSQRNVEGSPQNKKHLLKENFNHIATSDKERILTELIKSNKNAFLHMIRSGKLFAKQS